MRGCAAADTLLATAVTTQRQEDALIIVSTGSMDSLDYTAKAATSAVPPDGHFRESRTRSSGSINHHCSRAPATPRIRLDRL